MRLDRLEVRDFRGIQADVVFRPGLNVLHGPNELGKSTLVEAIRCALFVQTTSQAGNDYVTWGRQTPACVTLTFEHSDKLWRVSKRFGFRKYAAFECSDSGDPSRFRLVAEGNNVEGKLRELLAWGIAPPGGRGAAAKAESFLLTALLARQGEVDGILDASLDADRDDTGRSLVTRALGALDKDPLVAGILDTLEKRVDAVFTSQERFKTSAESPLVQRQDRLRGEEMRLASLETAESSGRAIQKEVIGLQDEREQMKAQIAAAEDAWRAATESHERAAAREKLQAELDELRRHLAEADRLTAELTALEGNREEASSNVATLEAAEQAAATAMTGAREVLQAAAETAARAAEAARQSGQVSEATRAQRHAELEARKAAVDARLNDVAAVERAQSDVASLQQQYDAAAAATSLAAVAVRQARHVLEYATLHDLIGVLEARESAASRAAGHLLDLQQLEQALRDRLRATESDVGAAEARRDRRESESASEQLTAAESELGLLRAVEGHIVLAAVHTEVEALETRARRARDLRAGAATGRAAASTIDQRVANRILPTREQVAAWRVLERQLQAEPGTDSETSSPLIPVVAALLSGVVAWAAVRFGLGWPPPTAVVAGVVVAAIVGGLAWFGLHGRNRASTAEPESQARHRERWTQEVQPSLRRAGLENLAAYEGAVADLDEQRTEAQRQRDQATQDELLAGEEERAAAILETRRELLARLEGEAPAADGAVVLERAAAFGADAGAVRRRITEQEQALEAMRASLRAAADADVQAAVGEREARRSECEALARQVAGAEAAVAAARQQGDPATLLQYRTRLAELRDAAAPGVNAAEATNALEAAKTQETTAATKADGLRARVAEARADADRRVHALGESPAEARTRASRVVDDIAAERAALDSMSPNATQSADHALETARIDHDLVTQELAVATAAFERAQAQRSQAEGVVRGLENDLAERRGHLAAMNRADIEARLQTVSTDPAFQAPDNTNVALDAATEVLDDLRQRLERCTSDLNHARGQLHLIAGHVGTERLEQQRDAVSFARAEVLECERTERAALRLLREIQKVEADRTTHLGRALAGPITDAFRALTGDRYGSISFTPNLKTEGIEASGAQRPLEVLSVGTREQLATLLRLAIAGHLHTAVVLDDQLVHSDTERLSKLSERLWASAQENNHQVIVFTCRQGDYLPNESDGDGFTVVDLGSLVSR